jgi:hypothetical protein
VRHGRAASTRRAAGPRSGSTSSRVACGAAGSRSHAGAAPARSSRSRARHQPLFSGGRRSCAAPASTPRSVTSPHSQQIWSSISPGCGAGCACGPGPRPDRRVPSGPEPTNQRAGPALGHPVRPGDLTVAPPLEHDRVHHLSSQIHRGPRRKFPRCSDTSVHCPVNSGTTRAPSSVSGHRRRMSGRVATVLTLPLVVAGPTRVGQWRGSQRSLRARGRRGRRSALLIRLAHWLLSLAVTSSNRYGW